jgi:hypothetical protein
MKKSAIAIPALLLLSLCAYSQGCVAIRNLAGFTQFSLPQTDADPAKWMILVNSRYSEFHGTYIEDQKLNLSKEDATYSHTLIVDFALMRVFDNGWSMIVDVPFMSAMRRNWQDHTLAVDSNKERHTTSSFGLSDIRVTAYKWLLDVSEPHRGNIQIGFGIKLPTGDYRYQDYFYRKSGREVAPVNPTLQLGDGGTGFTVELNGFFTLNKTISFFGNGFYLFNPRDQNGTNGTLGRPASNALKEAGGDVNSVPDAFLLRGGANFAFNNLVLWGGIRFEGSPVYDAFGASNGQRRAGYAVSIEPGLNYTLGKTTLFTFVPIPLYKTLKQTVPDKIITNNTGVYSPSPGGMVNYLIFFGASFRL